jgi:hypothetical protein
MSDVVSDPPAAAHAEPPAKFLGLSRVEGLSLVVFGIVVLALALGFLISAQKGRPKASGEKPAARLVGPQAGKLVTVTTAEPAWREKLANERGRPQDVIRPAVTLSLTGPASGSAYLRVTFLDAAGSTVGDLMTIRLTDGKIVDTGRGEIIGGPQTVTLRGTGGFAHETSFLTYLGQAGPRWSVRLEEGADYGSGPWTRLAWFELPNTSAQP